MSNLKWSAEINPVRAKIHLPRFGSRSIRDGQTLRSLHLQLLQWKGLVQVQCSLLILYLSFFDARDVIPLYMLHLRFTSIISIRSAPSMIKCSDSASKHHLASLTRSIAWGSAQSIIWIFALLLQYYFTILIEATDSITI